MYNEVKEYLKKVDGISHVTLDPDGPGVVRIHLVPPAKLSLGVPWAIILNGQDILPINTGWAILLREFINLVNETDGSPLKDEDVKNLINKTIDNVKKVFIKTERKILEGDLKDIVFTLLDIAKGKEPSVKIGFMSIKDYAKNMRAPFRMDLMISSMVKDGTWNCNQKCLHCYAGCQKLAIVKELDTDSWKKIIDKCRKAFIPQLTFTGGEPTLRPDLVELVSYASWFVTRLNTNGVNLTKELCVKLREASLDSVQITLYSSDKEIHNYLVGSNHFDDTIEGIKNAVEAGLNVSINTPLCSLNKNYKSLLEFGKRLGIRYFTTSGIIMTGKAELETSKETYLTKTELKTCLEEAINWGYQNELEISFTSPGWLDEATLKELKLNIPSCGACSSNMAIAPNGEVIPCQSYLTTTSLGNMLTSNWSSIWTSQACKLIRKKALSKVQVCLLSKGGIIE